MGNADGLAVGETAPEFVAPLVRPGEDPREVRLGTLLEEKPVLLCFYTNDFTPDCVGEWCEFRDFDWFDTGGEVQVVGISKSRPLTHQKFMGAFGLDFPLYSDPQLDVTDAFGVKYRVFKLAARSRRSCFLIDQDRTIRYKWLAEHGVDPTMATPPVDEVYEACREAMGVEPRPEASTADD